MGVFSKRASAAGGLWGLIVGFVLGMFRLLLKVIYVSFLDKDSVKLQAYITGGAIDPNAGAAEILTVKFLSINWLHYCVFLLLLCLIVIYVVSRFTKRPSPERIAGLTYGSASVEQIEQTRASWNKWDVIHSVIVLGIVVAFYICFW